MLCLDWKSYARQLVVELLKKPCSKHFNHSKQNKKREREKKCTSCLLEKYLFYALLLFAFEQYVCMCDEIESVVESLSPQSIIPNIMCRWHKNGHKGSLIRLITSLYSLVKELDDLNAVIFKSSRVSIVIVSINIKNPANIIHALQ